MKYECTLREFVKEYPVFKTQFSNLLSDPHYIAKFTKHKNGDICMLEVGYKEDLWAIDKFDK